MRLRRTRATETETASTEKVLTPPLGSADSTRLPQSTVEEEQRDKKRRQLGQPAISTRSQKKRDSTATSDSSSSCGIARTDHNETPSQYSSVAATADRRAEDEINEIDILASTAVISGVGLLTTYTKLIYPESIPMILRNELSKLREARPKVRVVFWLSDTDDGAATVPDDENNSGTAHRGTMISSAEYYLVDSCMNTLLLSASSSTRLSGNSDILSNEVSSFIGSEGVTATETELVSGDAATSGLYTAAGSSTNNPIRGIDEISSHTRVLRVWSPSALDCDWRKR